MRHAGLALLALAGCSAPSPPLAVPPLCALAGGPGSQRLALSDWQLRSSADVPANDADVANPRFVTRGWYPAKVPSTVAGTLVDDGVYTDVDVAMNLRRLPGLDYGVGDVFSKYEMADSNPFKTPWWYRTSFVVPPSVPGRHAWLRFEGVNYRASVWLNGRAVASEQDLAGTYRQFEYDVTDQLTSCGENVLAVKVRAQTLTDLGWNFVDWMPFPPDKLLGLWRPVTVVTTGPVRLRWPTVESKLALPGAELTVRAELENATAQAVTATLSGTVEGRAFAQPVTLLPHEQREVTLLAQDHPALVLARARLWWPAHLGTPELYTMPLAVDVFGQRSDEASVRFGVREVTSEITGEGHRLFRVNGEKVLIRGAGWTPDMMLRVVNDRIDTDLLLARDMNLNAIRLEGKVGFERLYERADELGLFVIAGWCCCDTWEEWPLWTAETRTTALASLRDQIRLLRGHPSALAWFNGSDGTPPPDVEQAYVDTLAAAHWPNPNVVSASDVTTPLGPSGVKMNGPYKWEPPSYWEQDTSFGGAFGFATEISIGEAVPPVESLRKMLAGHLWPIDDAWYYHLGTVGFGHMEPYVGPLGLRYGPWTSVEDFAARSQLSSYEGVRAMFEAYGRNKYHSTGVVQWMLNSGWPTLIWQLYDFYLKPGGGYFAAKLANEPLHIQYSYGDQAVVVVSSTRAPIGKLVASARVVDLAGVERYRQSQVVTVSADASVTAFVLPQLANLTTTYFVDLRLRDLGGLEVSRNFYWLSTKPDVLDYSRSELALTPTSSSADLTGLTQLPMTSVQAAPSRTGDDVHVLLTNAGPSLAFFTRVTVADLGTHAEIVPVRWSDNYVSLWPGESRELVAHLPAGARAALALDVAGWNVAQASSPVP